MRFPLKHHPDYEWVEFNDDGSIVLKESQSNPIVLDEKWDPGGELPNPLVIRVRDPKTNLTQAQREFT